MRYALLGMLLVLGGCVTDPDLSWVAANYPTRAEVALFQAEMSCKSMARTLVQIARCEVRR